MVLCLLNALFNSQVCSRLQIWGSWFSLQNLKEEKQLGHLAIFIKLEQFSEGIVECTLNVKLHKLWIVLNPKPSVFIPQVGTKTDDLYTKGVMTVCQPSSKKFQWESYWSRILSRLILEPALTSSTSLQWVWVSVTMNLCTKFSIASLEATGRLSHDTG